MIFSTDYSFVLISRFLGGLGHGMLFVCIQYYILRLSKKSSRSNASSIIVVGYNAGIVSGVLIGSTLVDLIGFSNVFSVYLCLFIFLFIYTFYLLPNLKAEHKTEEHKPISVLKMISKVSKDSIFMRVSFLIGIPLKIILSGTIIFALPLVLAQKGFSSVDIGHIIIFYSLGVILMIPVVKKFSYICPLRMIIGGSVLGALFVIGISLYQNVGDSFYEIGLLLSLLAFLGMSHSFVHGPIITAIADSKVSNDIGSTSVVAFYRFVEKLGHAFGPMVVSAIFLISVSKIDSYYILGLIVLSLSSMFVLSEIVIKYIARGANK
jgi:predicted MFS family arabinose efflux permease